MVNPVFPSFPPYVSSRSVSTASNPLPAHCWLIIASTMTAADGALMLMNFSGYPDSFRPRSPAAASCA